MTDHFEQTASAVVVVLIDFEVFGEFVYTGRQDGDLDFGRTRVAFMRFVRGDYSCFFSLVIFITFQIIIPYTERSAGDCLPEDPACGRSSYRVNIIHYNSGFVKRDIKTFLKYL